MFQNPTIFFVLCANVVEWDRGAEAWKNRGRKVREAVVDMAESGRNRGKLHNIVQYSVIEKAQIRGRPTK